MQVTHKKREKQRKNEKKFVSVECWFVSDSDCMAKKPYLCRRYYINSFISN